MNAPPRIPRRNPTGRGSRLGQIDWYERNPARRVVLHLIQNVEQLLPDNRQIGRAGRVPGTRELVVPRTPYIVPYRIQRTTIQILRVYHGARRWPDSF
jgi:toxin ParE1/3/4